MRATFQLLLATPAVFGANPRETTNPTFPALLPAFYHAKTPNAYFGIYLLASQSHDGTLRSFTTTFYPSVSDALKARNVRAVKALYQSRIAPGFVYQEKNGKNLDFAKMIMIVREDITMPTKLDLAESVVHNQTDKGDHGLVVVWHKIRGTVVDRDKMKRELFIQGTSQDSWRKVSGRWELEKTAFVMHRYTLNGKGFGISANDRFR